MAMPAISATGSAPKPSTGFTLIELMVVLAIIVLLIAAIPFAANRLLPSRRVATTMDRLLQDMRWLEAQSIASGAAGRLTLESRGYRLHVGSTAESRQLPASTVVRIRAVADNRPLTDLAVFPDGTRASGILEVEDSGRRAQVELTMLPHRARPRD